MLNNQEGRISVPINKSNPQHVAGLDEKLIQAGLLPKFYQYHQLAPFLDRLRGTNHEPMMVVGHPLPDTDSSARVVREHKIDDALALLADPNGPEAELRKRRKREIERHELEQARKAEEERQTAVAQRQQRWDAMTETQRALWLVAARTKPYAGGDYGQVNHARVVQLLAQQQQQFLETFARALVDAKSTAAPADLINAPHFAE